MLAVDAFLTRKLQLVVVENTLNMDANAAGCMKKVTWQGNTYICWISDGPSAF